MCVKSKSTLTLKEVRNVLNTLERDVALIVVVLVLTGIRVDEAADLLWSDVDLDNNLMSVTNNQTGKKRNIRIFPVVKDALMEIRETQNDETYVFNYNGKKDHALIHNVPRDEWKRAFKALRMDQLKLTDLRRTFKQIMLDWGEAKEFVHNQLHGTKWEHPHRDTEPHNYVAWNDWKRFGQKPKRCPCRCYCQL